MLAVLVDPDKSGPEECAKLAEASVMARVDYFFCGSSLITKGNMEDCISTLKSYCNIPVIIFPGSHMQVSGKADALLFLSLVSGRNPEMLIGKHVLAAPAVKKSGIEVIPTAYLLIDGGKLTSVNYMSNTLPIPADKPDIAACTAMAAEMLGMKLIYLDAGSGAENTVSPGMIAQVKTSTSLPLIAGGGIRTAKEAEAICRAGADMIVIGNVLEKDLSVLEEISDAVHAVYTN